MELLPLTSVQPSPSFRGTLSIIGEALTLNPHFYRDVHDAPRGSRNAQIVVAIAGGSHGLGSLVILLIQQVSWAGLGVAFLINSLSVVLGYYLWTLTVWKIYGWLRPRRPGREAVSTYRELLSPIGFAYAPQMLNVLTVVPFFGPALELGLALWTLLTVTASLHHGLGLSLGRAIFIGLVGWPLVRVGVSVLQFTVQGWLT